MRRTKPKPYPSDLTDRQWVIVAALIPGPRPGGRPRVADMRAVVNAVLYVCREGCTWRALPRDFPAWRTVYNYYRDWQVDGTLDGLLHALRRQVRAKAGRDPEPSAAAIDSQSVKAVPGGGPTGADGGKLVKGRKRHVLACVIGMVLAVVVTPANADDGTTAPRVLAAAPAGEFRRLRVVWGDRKYNNRELDRYLAGRPDLRVVVPQKPPGAGFVPEPERWVVEQAFAVMGRWRRLTVDREVLPACSEAMVKLSAIHRMARRLAPRRQRRFTFRRKRR